MAKLTDADLQSVQAVLGRIDATDPAYDFASNKWAAEVKATLEKGRGNKFGTSLFAGIRVFFLVPLPLLARLRLQGNGGTWIRCLKFDSERAVVGSKKLASTPCLAENPPHDGSSAL